MKKNDIKRLNIVSVTSEGNGVAKEDEYVFFVPYALVGEEVNVKILKIKKNIVYTKVIDILKPSHARISSLCDNFCKCGGCTYLNMNYETQLEYKLKKINDALERIGKLNIKAEEIIPSPVISEYRNKALIPVSRDLSGNIICGFFKNRTHNVIDMNKCYIQDKDAFSVVKTVKEWMNNFNIEPYDEVNHKGLIRHIYFRKGVHTKDIMAGIVSYNKNVPHLNELTDMLKENVYGLKSIILNINDKHTNVILGEKTVTLYGTPYITDKIGSLTFKIGPLSFFQVNPYNVGNLYNKAIDSLNLNKNDILFDIYCGIGTIGLSAANKVKEIIGVEIIPEAVEYARENANMNNIANATFYTGKAEDVIYKMEEELNTPTAVILDPPRAGCDKTLIDEIIKLKPEKICYVSCDPATLARDLKIFKESEEYEIKEVIGCDMFPNTFHVESVSLLVRTDSTAI